MTFRDTEFRLLAERDDATLTGKSVSEFERRGIGRLELREILLQGLTSGSSSAVHWGKALAHYERLQNGRVRVHFADGTSEEGDILVGADGSRSKVREQYLPHIQGEDLGIVAIAGRYILNKQRMRELPTGLTNGSLNNIVPDGKGWMFISSWHSRPADDGKEADHYVVWAYVIPKEDAPENVRSLSPAQLRDVAMSGTAGVSKTLGITSSEISETCAYYTQQFSGRRLSPHLSGM
jgi:2-polyprenyl-6-methoxyphenol hydroxylase-like FAD-dependent oxidoreductase